MVMVKQLENSVDICQFVHFDRKTRKFHARRPSLTLDFCMLFFFQRMIANRSEPIQRSSRDQTAWPWGYVHLCRRLLFTCNVFVRPNDTVFLSIISRTCRCILVSIIRCLSGENGAFGPWFFPHDGTFWMAFSHHRRPFGTRYCVSLLNPLCSSRI